MQLDHTRIAIRERTLSDILDLSLQVGSAYLLPWLVCTAAIAVPLMAINFILLRDLAPVDSSDTETLMRYLWVMSALVTIEAPLTSLLSTLYFGQVLFRELPRRSEMLSNLWKALPALILYQGILRGILPAWFVAANLVQDVGGYDVLLVLLWMVSLAIRAFRPFIIEVILLERNPMRRRPHVTMTVSMRSASLHRSNSGDLFARSLVCGILAAALVFVFVCGIRFSATMLFFQTEVGPGLLHFGVPWAMWTVAGFFSIVRFLSYLDLRIRREGWEVQLLMRAAGAKLAGQVN